MFGAFGNNAQVVFVMLYTNRDAMNVLILALVSLKAHLKYTLVSALIDMHQRQTVLCKQGSATI